MRALDLKSILFIRIPQYLFSYFHFWLSALTAFSSMPVPAIEEPTLWKQKYANEYGGKPPVLPSSPALTPTAEEEAETWKQKFAAEKKVEQAVDKVDSQGMYFVSSGDKEARLQFYNPQNDNKFSNYQIVYTAPGQATIQSSQLQPSSSSTSSGPYGHIAGLKFEGEHDNIARPDWKNFKPPQPEEEPALMYAYSPDASDVDFREQRVRRK